MPEMYLIQPRFRYHAFVTFTETEKQKHRTPTPPPHPPNPEKKTGDLRYVDFKASDRVLRDKAIDMLKKYDKYKRGLASMVYKIFD